MIISRRPNGIVGYRPAGKLKQARRAAVRDYRNQNRPLSNAEKLKSDQVIVGHAMLGKLRERGLKVYAEQKKERVKRREDS